MPIRKMLESARFDEHLAKILGHVFDDLCAELRLADRDDPLCEFVAKLVIECAKSGERNPEKLTKCVRAKLNG